MEWTPKAITELQRVPQDERGEVDRLAEIEAKKMHFWKVHPVCVVIAARKVLADWAEEYI